jgi:hypothetical protein
VRVGRRGEDVLGLVDEEHHALLGSLEELAVDGDAAVDVHVAGGVGDDLVGDRHAPVADDLLRATSGRDTGMGEEFGEPHAYDGGRWPPSPTSSIPR